MNFLFISRSNQSNPLWIQLVLTTLLSIIFKEDLVYFFMHTSDKSPILVIKYAL